MNTCYEHYDEFIECRWDVWLWRTMFPFLLLFGTFGNVMNVIILLRKRLRKSPTTVHLIALAVADLCTLWSYVFSTTLLNGFGIDIRTTSLLICKIRGYITHTSGGFSIWTVVALTVERMILTRYPLFSRSKLTRRSAFITSVVCLWVVAGLFIHRPFAYGIRISDKSSEDGTVGHKSCTAIELKDFYKKIWPVCNLLLFNLIPTAILLLANGMIIATLVSQRKRFCTVNSSERVNQPNRHKKTRSSTRMILGINAFFILTTLPFLVKRVFESQTTLPTGALDQAKYILYDSVFKFVLCCNYAFNFILYCVSGTIFHEELKSFADETKQKISKLFAFRMGTNFQNNSVIAIASSTDLQNTTGF